jgi:hypothetical protein
MDLTVTHGLALICNYIFATRQDVQFHLQSNKVYSLYLE